MSEIRTTLNGNPIVLRATLRAAKEANATFGSLSETFRKLSEFNLDAFVTLVAVGTGKMPKEVEQDVFETGLPDLLVPLTRFCTMLANGGREPNAVKDSGEKPAGE